MRMPLAPDRNLIMALHLFQHLARLPVPKVHRPLAVAARHKPPIGRAPDLRRIPGHIMTLKVLCLVHLEPIMRRIDHNLVIEALAEPPLAARVQRGGRHAVHRRVGHVLDDDGDAPVPHANGLVVARADKAAVVVDEADRVDSAKVRVIVLDDLVRASVKLEDFFGVEAGEEAVLLVIVGVELDAVGDALCAIVGNALAWERKVGKEGKESEK